MTVKEFRAQVAKYIERNKIAPTTFGRKVLGDPAWVSRLMAGLEPKERTREAVTKAMKEGVR